MHPQRGLFFIFILFNSFIWAQPQVKEYNCQGEKLVTEKNRTGLYRLDKKAMKEIIRCNPDTKTVVFFFPIWCAPCHEHFNYLLDNIDLQKYTLLITSIEKEQSNRATHFFNAFYKPKKQNKKMFPYPVFILSDEYLSGVVLRSKNKAENFLAEYDSKYKNAQTNGNVAIFSEDNELIYFGSFEDYLIN